MSACSLLPHRTTNHRAPTYTAKQQTSHNTALRPQPQRVYTPSQRQRSPRPQVTYKPRIQTPPQQSPITSIHPARLRMVNVAKSVVGVPYKWGGNSPEQGFDCSGLTRFVHKNALGLNIPRITAKQRDNSRTINYAQLQPGDMLFFKTSSKSNHVGIYIGNRKFIHAPSSGKRVSVATMDSSYWHKRFVKFGTYL